MNEREVRFEIIPIALEQYHVPIAKFLRDVNITTIPSDYIKYIEVKYKNGKIIKVNGVDITEPIKIRKYKDTRTLENLFKNISHVKVFLDFEQMQEKIDNIIDNMFQTEFDK